MNSGIGLLLVGLLAAGGVGAIAVSGPGPVSNGASPGDCASMHASNAQGHPQCSGETRYESHASCDPTGMPSTECGRMASYMGGSGMTSFCH